tara:strand:- start:370 stop:852 length:483 start_codon:yes stop_codon:yes gene_type:complete
MFINKLIVAKSYMSIKTAIKDKRKLLNLYKELFFIIGSNNKYIIDCGANIGYRAAIFSNVTSNQIYYFETYSINYQLLKRNFECNKYFKLFNYRLSDHEKTVDMGYPINREINNIDFGAVSYINKIDKNNKLIAIEKINLINFKNFHKRKMHNKDIVSLR